MKNNSSNKKTQNVFYYIDVDGQDIQFGSVTAEDVFDAEMQLEGYSHPIVMTKTEAMKFANMVMRE